jgi:hypothetical protein
MTWRPASRNDGEHGSFAVPSGRKLGQGGSQHMTEPAEGCARPAGSVDRHVTWPGLRHAERRLREVTVQVVARVS